MSKRIYVDFTYLIMLAATFGAVIVLGAISAPVIFNANNFLVASSLDQYNSGIIMGEIFHRFSYWVYIVAFSVFTYEAVSYKSGERDSITLASSAVIFFSSLMFSSVYSPKILSMQMLGEEATRSDTFQNIHTAAEIDFKILAIALIVLFVRRLMLLRRA